MKDEPLVIRVKQGQSGIDLREFRAPRRARGDLMPAGNKNAGRCGRCGQKGHHRGSCPR